MFVNCPNCGAPLTQGVNECGCCGTSYYDLSTIPLRKPFYLQINIGSENEPQIVGAMVRAESLTIEQKAAPAALYLDNRPYYQIETAFMMEFVSNGEIKKFKIREK